MGYDVFISYKWSTGRRYAEKLAEQLAAKKYRCFLDSEELPTGSDLREDVRLAAHFSRALVVVATGDALASKHVRYEIQLFDREMKQIVPIDVDDALYVTQKSSDGSIAYLKSPKVQTISANVAPEEQAEIEQTFNLIARDRRLQIDEYDSDQPSGQTIEDLSRRFDFTRRVHRRQRIITATCVVLIGLFLAVLWFSLEANKQRDHAEANLGEALKVANVIAEQVDRKLKDIPGAETVRQSLLKPGYAMLENLLIRAPDNAKIGEERARISVNLGEWYFQNGSLEIARENLQRSAQIYERVQGAENERIRALLSLARIERDLTNYDAAEKLCETALELAERQGKVDSASRHKAAAFHAKADVLTHRARLQESLEMFQKAQAIRREIVMKEESLAGDSFPEALLDFQASTDRIGHVARLLKNEAVQQQAHKENYTVAVRLVGMHPENGQYLRSLSLAAARLGYDALEAGDLAAADKYLTENESVSSDLLRRAPASKTYRYDWSIALSDLGDLRTREKRFPEAKKFYEHALSELDKAIKADPANAIYFGQKIVTTNARGNMEIAAENATEALVHYERAAELTDEAIRNWPDMPNQRLAKALILSAMSQAVVSQFPEKSSKWAKNAREVLIQLVADHPNEELYKSALDGLPPSAE